MTRRAYWMRLQDADFVDLPLISPDGEYDPEARWKRGPVFPKGGGRRVREAR